LLCQDFIVNNLTKRIKSVGQQIISKNRNRQNIQQR
jgi:hypothetical protein